MPLPATAAFSDVELDGNPYAVELQLEQTAEGVRPVTVKVTAQEGSPPVSGTVLRAVRVWDLAVEAILRAVRPSEVESTGGGVRVTRIASSAALSDEDVARLRAQGPTDETLRWVAYFYNLGAVIGLPPARQVELNLGLPRTTASKWVRRAREKGLIRGEHPAAR
ncbi:hypothetical protein [Georgenia wangjunii]|uniref:hypothetical protein n=1 Tax=Georgenia wangjunii TaxID=3117730 RepID=UPI002F26D2AC